jgi:hypothetical protein
MAQGTRKDHSLVRASVRKGLELASVAAGHATSGLRIEPSWFIVGGQRCGSSSLYEYMVAHPLIPRSGVKEIHYYDNNFQRGDSWYRAFFPTRLYARLTAMRLGREPLAGDATPYYMVHPHALGRIAKTYPNARILVVLRNPVDRAYSHFFHERGIGHEPLASFEEAIDREPERLKGELERMLADPAYYSFAHQNFSYVARGYYDEQLEHLFALFPRENVKVLSSGELSKETARTMAGVFQFLGLPSSGQEKFRRENARSYPPMDASTRQRLQATFAPHNERLFAMLGVDYGWNRKA